MIDHLTPYEGIVFGGIITIGLLSMLSTESSTQFLGAVLLCAGFWGGIITLIRAWLQRLPGSLYVLCFIASLISGLIKYFVFPDLGQNGGNRITWVFIIGIGITGLVGVTLNALIREPKGEAQQTFSQFDRPDSTPSNPGANPLRGEDEALRSDEEDDAADFQIN